MNSKATAILGIMGALFFISTAVISGFQFDNYNHISQFISEAYAFGTPYGLYLRLFGYIPSGIMLAMFGFGAYTHFKKSLLTKVGFIGFALFYGIGTVIVSIFPCDAGCTTDLLESSVSQIIHNLLSVAVYLIVPWCLVVIGMGFRKTKTDPIATTSIILGAISGIFAWVLFSDPNSPYVGLFQRIIETCILGWVFIMAIFIWINTKKSRS